MHHRVQQAALLQLTDPQPPAVLCPAASLTDRVRAGPVLLPSGDGGESRAARRLLRWSTQPPFDEPPWWERRLSGAGLSGAALQDLLAEPAAALAARLPARPEWLAELDDAYWRGEADDDDHDEPPLARLAGPLLVRARRRLADRLAALDPTGRVPFDPRELLTWLYPPLPRLVDRMVTRTLALELNVARVLGTLPGETPEARFTAFCAGLRGPARRRQLLGEYPVLGRLLATVAMNWVRAGALFARRLVDDWPRLAAAFGPGGSLGPVTGLATGLGDPHRGGHTVLAVTCAGNVRIVYKPRPVSAEVHVGHLLEWLAARGLADPPRVPSTVDRREYGWAEFVTPRPCANAEELGRFYRRHGILLAVLYLLRAGDLNAENLIAAGDHPVPVDLEAVCQPELSVTVAGALAAEQTAAAAASGSVLRVGLLPMQAWNTAAGGGADLSGLGAVAGQLSPLALPELAGAGTDRMVLRLRRRPLDPAANLPVEGGTGLRVLDYCDDIVAGFTQAYDLCRRHRRELLAADGPLAAFAGDEVRVLVRSTAEYALLRDTGHHPDMLRDGLDQERHLDRLWRGVSRRPALAACVEAERDDLWRQDIPAFTARTDEAVLRSSTGDPIPGIVRRTGLDSVRQTVALLGPADRTRQIWLIRTALAASTMNLRELEYARYPLPATRTPPGPDRLVAEADAIGRHLASIAFRAPDSAQWLGVVSRRGTDWSLGPLGPDLCTGGSGLALFFGLLGQVTGERDHTALARAALATARSQVDRRAMAQVGGMAGLGGICYAFTQLGALWEDDELLDHAVSLAVLCGQWADGDEQYDFTSGSAGSIAALRALHAVRPAGPVRDAIRACAERLLAGRHRAAWLPSLMREGGVADAPLAGLAHGAAGVAWPLLEAAEVCAEPRYRAAALAAIGYERSLFLPEAGTWRDLRHEAAGEPFDLSGWCHGAAGLGLARIRSLPYLDGAADEARAEILAAVGHTVRVGFGRNHSLCHGDIGNVELLALAGEALAEPRWCDEARGLLGAVIESMGERGWISGVPHGVPTPGLLLGFAGTGYGLLRAAAPQRVPSVLTLDSPPAR